MVAWKVNLTLWGFIGNDVTPVARALSHDRDLDGIFFTCYVACFVFGVSHIDGVAHGQVQRDAIAHKSSQNLCAVVVFRNMHDAIEGLAIVEIGTDNLTDWGARVLDLDRGSVKRPGVHDLSELGLCEVEAVVRVPLPTGVTHSQQKRCECICRHK